MKNRCDMSEEKVENIFTPPHEQVTDKIFEKWEIIALPDNENPCTEPVKPSKHLQKFTERIKKQYEDYITDIQADFEDVNKEIEIEIRLKSSSLKEKLNTILLSGQDNIANLILSQEQIFDFDEHEFNKSKLFCENLLENGKILINRFYESLQNFEKYRSDRFKEILKIFYDKMEKCTYKLPYEIQLFFEEQILHINQILLSNIRNYKELHLDIMTTFINSIKFLLYNIISYEKEWNDICKEKIIERLKSFNLSDDKINEFFDNNKNKETRELIELFYQYVDSLENSYISDPEEIEWFSETSVVIQELEKNGSVLEMLFNTVATELSSDIKVKILKENLLTLAIRRSEVIRLDSLTFNIDLESAKEVSLDNEGLKKLWKITLKEFLQYLHMKYIFLRDLNDLWANHDKRIEELQLAVTTELDQLVEKNDKLLQEKQEMPLNIAIDTLRQELNENKMTKTMKKIENILNKMSQTMTTYKNSELKLISKYSDHITNESEIYLTAIEGFVEKYERKKPIPVIQPALATKNNILYMELENVGRHMMDLLKSKKKIIQTIKLKMDTYVKAENDYAKLWMEEATKKIDKKFGTKLDFHNLRLARIQLEIYDVRLAEIRKHQEKFDSHKTAVENRILQLQNDAMDYQNNLQTDSNEFNIKIRELAEESETSKTTQEAIIYEMNIENLIKNKTNYMTESVKNYSEQILNAINQILTSNYNFLQFIKLFHEGGNYNPKEASVFSKKLLQIETSVQKQSLTIKSELSTTQKKIQKSYDTASVICLFQANSMHQILEFKEISESQIETLQKSIKKEVYKMKLEMKKIDTINERVKQLANTNNFSTVCSVIKYLTGLINHCKEYREYLEDLDNPSRIYNNVDDMDLSQINVTVNSKMSKKTQTTTKSKKDTPRSEGLNIFEFFNPASDSKFMPEICNIIQEIFHKVQSLAREFYDKQLKLQTISLPLTLNQFLVATMKKFKYYYLQCLQTWSIEIQELMITTDEIHQFTNEYCDNYLSFITEQQYNIFSDKLKSFVKDIDDIKSLQTSEIKEIHAQLKPLHGYHGNKHLLSDLNKKINEAINNAKNEFNYHTQTFQNYLEECKASFKKNVTEANILVDDFKRSVLFDADFCKNLIRQARTSIKLTNLEDYDIDFPSVFTNYEEENLKENSEITFGENPTEIDNNHQDVLEMKEVTETTEFYKQKIEEMKVKFGNKITAMLETWNKDVQKVKNLYTVKYD